MSKAKDIIQLIERYQYLHQHYLELTNDSQRQSALILKLRDQLSQALNELKTLMSLDDPTRDQIEVIQARYQPHHITPSFVIDHAESTLKHLQKLQNDRQCHQQTVEHHTIAIANTITLLQENEIEQSTAEESLEQFIHKHHIKARLERYHHELIQETGVLETFIHMVRIHLATFFQFSYLLNAHIGDDSILHAPEVTPEFQEICYVLQETYAHFYDAIREFEKDQHDLQLQLEKKLAEQKQFLIDQEQAAAANENLASQHLHIPSPRLSPHRDSGTAVDDDA